MERVNIPVDIMLCQENELDAKDRQLVDKAITATAKSYSPYSHFRVGAALRLADGTVVIGANQENAAFSVTTCAERSAIYAAQAQHPDQSIVSLAIAARNEDGFTDEPVSPCGMCRQAMVEIEQRYSVPIRILLYGRKGIYVMNSIRNLMPLSFTEF